jgi:hypothetical protein
MYKTVNVGLNVLLRGANQQTASATGLLHQNAAITRRVNASDPVRRVRGYQLHYGRIHNRSGGAVSCGIGVRIPNDLWQAGTVSAAGAYTDATATAQSSAANSTVLETTDNDSGIAFVSDVPFNAIGINVTTASVDATDPTRTLSHSSGAGTWTAFTNEFLWTGRATEYSVGENPIVFAAPSIWGLTTGAELTGIPSGKYGIFLKSTTAPDTTAAIAGGIELYHIYMPQEAVADNGVWEYAAGIPLNMPYGDAIVAFISSIAALQSVCTVNFSPGTPFA